MKKQWAQRDLNGSRPVEPASTNARSAGKTGLRADTIGQLRTAPESVTGNMVATASSGIYALGVLLALVLVACGGSTEDPAPDCSKAECTVVSTMTETGCRVSIPACDGLYAQLCPPSPGFALICRNHLR